MQSLSPTLGGRVWATTTILLLLPLPPYELHFHFLPIHLSAKGFLCLMYQRPRDCSSPPFFTRCPLLASMSTPHHDPRSYPGKIKRLARNVSPSFCTYLIGCLFIFNLIEDSKKGFPFKFSIFERHDFQALNTYSRFIHLKWVPIFEFPKIWKIALRIFQIFEKPFSNFEFCFEKYAKQYLDAYIFWGKCASQSMNWVQSS